MVELQGIFLISYWLLADIFLKSQNHNDQNAKVETFHLDPVTLAHNVLFDPSVWFIAHFFLRGLLDYNVRTPFFFFCSYFSPSF